MSYPLAFILGALAVSVISIVLLSKYLKLHPFFCLVFASLLLGLLVGQNLQTIIRSMQEGFSVIMRQIAFIVTLGSCLGMLLEKTGAMNAIGARLLRIFGRRRSTYAMGVIGLIVGVPVFCDSGFIILSRMIPSVVAQANVAGGPMVLALSTGLYTTHTLVPPTPGPLAAAANLGLTQDLGLVILIGLAIAIPTGLVGMIAAAKLGRKLRVAGIDVPLQAADKNLPAALAFLPLIVPVMLIAAGSISTALTPDNAVAKVLDTAGNPVVALGAGLLCSAFLIQKQQRSLWPAWITEALRDAGLILLITGAGGAFGFVIKNTGIDAHLKAYVTSIHASGAFFLLIAFLIAAILKTAQGSTTSAIVITSSLLAPVAAVTGFLTAPQLCCMAVAIGGGSMAVSHANDSYFWVISQFGRVTAPDVLKTFTPITLLQGVTALIASIILFLLL